MAALAHAELKDPFRTKFNYNNILFLAAGTAAANAAGTNWDAMVKERIFTPLGMLSTSTTYEALRGDARAATGYAWQEEEKSYKVLPPRNLNSIAPAGAINSNVLEMSNWVRLQLGRGTFEGKELVKKATIEEMWKPNIDIDGATKYGLGWFLRSWNGKKMVDHGGNIDGYSSSLAFLPDDGVGFVLLENVSASALQGEAMSLIFGAIFPPPPDADANALTGEKLGEYVGKYRFEAKSMDMTALVKEGKLFLDVPGQTAYELKWPNAEGKWFFALTDTIAVKFEREDGTRVSSLTMYQSGMEFKMPKEGVVVVEKPDPNAVPAVDLQKYVGKYDFTPTKQQWAVAVKKGKLVIDVPGQMVYDLKWPNDEKKWVLAQLPDAKLVFNAGDDGAIKSATLFQAGQQFDLPRIAGGSAQAWPTVEQLMAKRVPIAAAVGKLGNIRLLGKIQFLNEGVDGTVTTMFSGTDRFIMEMNMGVYGSLRASADGGRAWSESMAEPFKELKGKELDELGTARPPSMWDDLRTMYDQVEVTGVEKLGDVEVAVVKASKKDGGKSTTQYINPATGLSAKEVLTITVPQVGPVTTTIVGSDPRDIGGGVMMPFRLVIESPLNGKTVITFEKAESGVKAADDAYVLKPSTK